MSYTTDHGIDRVMFAQDIVFEKITADDYLEQYDAVDSMGHVIGYVRAKRGYCDVYCPDCDGDNLVYDADFGYSWGGFPSDDEREKHFNRIRERIAAWCNEHPGLYGSTA